MLRLGVLVALLAVAAVDATTGRAEAKPHLSHRLVGSPQGALL